MNTKEDSLFWFAFRDILPHTSRVASWQDRGSSWFRSPHRPGSTSLDFQRDEIFQNRGIVRAHHQPYSLHRSVVLLLPAVTNSFTASRHPAMLPPPPGSPG